MKRPIPGSRYFRRGFFPFWTWASRVNRQTLRQDLFAGLTNAVVVLPQGVAFAAIAGLPPQYGLYTAMVPPILAAIFGSSWHLISGPTTALSIVTFATLIPFAEPGSETYIHLAFTLACLVGIIQLGLGIARLGALVNFVSHSVVVGFTSGAALLIAASQVKHILGVQVASGVLFPELLMDLVRKLPATNLAVLSVGLTTLGVSVFFRVFRPRWPGMLIGMVVGGMLAYVLGAESSGIPLVGALPAQPPPLSAPIFSPEMVRNLMPGAFALALLGLIEAVSIARSVALHSHQRINGNWEFIGQGMSNLVGGFFSCYPSSGSFTRTGINYRAGAKTPMAAIFAAFALMLILLFVAPLAAYLPIAAMGGVILLVAYSLIDFGHIAVILKSSRSESMVFLVTFLATLLIHLEFSIYLGVFLSVAVYLATAASPKVLSWVPDATATDRHFTSDPRSPECSQLKIAGIEGSIFFGAVNHVEEELDRLRDENPERKHLLLVSSGINFIDVAGAELLLRESERRRADGGGLYLYGVREQVCGMFRRSGHIEAIGRENVFQTKTDAIHTIVTQRLDKERCKTCRVRLFTECSANREDPLQGVDAKIHYG